MVRAVKILSDFINKKIWTIPEFFILSAFIALNPLMIVALEYVLGIQFLSGLIAGMLIFLAAKTQWRTKDV
jgi:thiamine transporter ThiT